jgi:HSP90 family molecular chaperone
LGTIARSGSKHFLEQLDTGTPSSAKDTIIGQFGVGFYSAFMVGSRVRVYTRSAVQGSPGYCWESDGQGSYTITPADNVQVGTKIAIELKPGCEQFSKLDEVKKIITKHSNFVNFSILVNNDKVNTVSALWATSKSKITDEQYTEFYRFVGNTWDTPQYRLHYSTDVPLEIKSLLYIPGFNTEQAAMTRMEPGVSLYSRKVLIQHKTRALFPEWLRFIRGVVDSHDIPLNLSRELLQNSLLIGKLKRVLTSRVIKWLQDEAKHDPTKYNQFYKEFGSFIKEGVCTDTDNKDAIANLLRYETSTQEAGHMSSLQDYVESMSESQTSIYYLQTPNRTFAEQSPYMEPFLASKTRVLYLFDARDDYVMSALGKVKGKTLVNVDSEQAGKEVSMPPTETALNQEQSSQLTTWLTTHYGTRVKEVVISTRLVSHPAVVTDHESPTVRQMMRLMASEPGMELPTAPVKLEINPNHPIVQGLSMLHTSNQELASLVADQLLDNAMIAAGALDDPRSMLPRLDKLLHHITHT